MNCTGWVPCHTSDVELIELQANNDGCDTLEFEYPVRGHSSVVTSRGVLTCGGSSRIYLSKCILQRIEGKTSSFPSMIRSRRYFGLAENGNKLFVIGGIGAENKMETISIYGDQWFEENLPFNTSGNCVFSVNDTIISIGGMQENGKVSEIIDLGMIKEK